MDLSLEIVSFSIWWVAEQRALLC